MEMPLNPKQDSLEKINQTQLYLQLRLKFQPQINSMKYIS
jgi:hypothetical protein